MANFYLKSLVGILIVIVLNLQIDLRENWILTMGYYWAFLPTTRYISPLTHIFQAYIILLKSQVIKKKNALREEKA